MGRDELVEAAVANWAPRFTAQGVPLSDFEEVAAEVSRWDEWCAAWSARGASHERLADEAAASGHALTESEHLTRASLCYHFGKFLFVQAPDEMRAAHARAVACRDRAMPLLRPAGERIEVPFAGRTMPGYLRRPEGVARPPVVLLIPGLDSTKEEMDAREARFLARGLATLAMDGPGQGECEYDLPIRADYETPVAAMVDWIESRSDLDSDRVGIWGVSLGGYYAPRAASAEPRISACVALAGPYCFGANWDRLPELTREAFRVRSHTDSEAAARAHADTLDLAGAAERITCPLLVVFGKQDRLIDYRDAERLAAEASGPTDLWMIEDGNHGAANRSYRHASQTADWVADRLA